MKNNWDRILFKTKQNYNSRIKLLFAQIEPKDQLNEKFLHQQDANKMFCLFQAISCLCYTCGNSGPQLYSCLHCIFFGCKGQHIVDHLESKRHHIALELSFGMIYCHTCRDFIYDPECYAIAEKHLRKEAR